MTIIEPSVEILNTTADPLELIELAGRTAYRSEPKGNPEAFVRNLIKRGHESVLEHASSTFRIVTDRGVMAELTRHRAGVAFTVESTRYCRYGGGIKVIEPALLTKDSEPGWQAAVRFAYIQYRDMIRTGCAPQTARSVLPTCTATTIVMTANWREWRHILRLRTAPDAHPDCRLVMRQVLEWFRENYQVIVEDIP